MAQVALISCASKKLSEPERAENIYVSPLFVKSKEFARSSADKWFILSAEYGLLDPERRIVPYDKTLLKMSKAQQIEWTHKVIQDLLKVTSPKDSIIILAGEAYRRYLVPELERLGYSIQIPAKGLSIGKQLQWLNTKNFTGELKRDLETFYQLLNKLESGVKQKRIFGDCDGKMLWPNKGVYFFFEKGEYRTNSRHTQRVIRVGTHAVSQGAASTLWGRLRNHKGTPNGLGNHRGSIFRLHVGTAMLRRMGHQERLPSWGIGQTANQNIRRTEEWLERQVTEYLSESISLLWIDVGDPSSSFSDRAFIERNAIALISNNKNPFDSPSPVWLGNFSTKEEIRKSGLWNMRHVADKYDPKFIEIFSEYVDVTLGIKPAPNKSISPLKKIPVRNKHPQNNQLNLFDNK